MTSLRARTCISIYYNADAQAKNRSAGENFGRSSDPVLKARNQLFGKADLGHGVLGLGKVVLDTMRYEDIRVGIVNGVRGARVAIARLSDTANVYEGFWFELYFVAVLERLRRQGAFFEVEAIGDREVGVSNKTKGGVEMGEIFERGPCIVNVFPNGMTRAAMCERNAKFLQHRMGGTRGEPFAVFGCQGFARPFERQTRRAAKLVEGDIAQRGLIVIACERNGVGCAEARYTFIRLWPIADDIAQTPNRVVMARGMQDRFQSDEIGVNVRKQQNTHRSAIVT